MMLNLLGGNTDRSGGRRMFFQCERKCNKSFSVSVIEKIKNNIASTNQDLNLWPPITKIYKLPLELELKSDFIVGKMILKKEIWYKKSVYTILLFYKIQFERPPTLDCIWVRPCQLYS